MPRVCVVGDSIIGICDHGQECCPHNVTGYFTEGSPTVSFNNKPVVRDGDRCRTTCPHCHTGYAVGRSSRITVDGKPVHRLGDPVVLGGGTGISVTASTTIEDNS
jgi:uncharacterized Zn-binding protein involved in type VI secretion